MDYHLPTTAKLIGAYEENGCPAGAGREYYLGEKKEIEGTLDTINDAFEKLLDSFLGQSSGCFNGYQRREDRPSDSRGSRRTIWKRCG